MKKNQQHKADPRKGTCQHEGEIHNEDHALWSRRQFMLTSGLASLGSALFAGNMPVQALANSPLLEAIANADNERVLVIVNLSGGNDGLNTVVPRFNDIYYSLRPTIAIQEDNLFNLSSDFGMPNDMLDLQPLWGDGKMAVVHNVAYPNQNLSHFRSTDIWVEAMRRKS